jgi:hypothetical protein
MKLGFLLFTAGLLLLALFNAAVHNYSVAGLIIAVVVLRSLVHFGVFGRLRALRRTERFPEGP